MPVLLPTKWAYPGWVYCTAFPITGAAGQIICDITFTLLSSQVKADGSDLRAALDDGTKIPLNVQSITGGGTKTIRAYITFPAAPADGSKVFFYSGISTPYDDAAFSILDRFRSGVESGVVVTIPAGINEFCIRHEQGQYQLFCTQAGVTVLYQSPTLAGLSSAAPHVCLPVHEYPCAIFEGGLWHIWANIFVGSVGHVSHFISATSSPESLYTYNDEIDAAADLADAGVIHFGGFYYCAVWDHGVLAGVLAPTRIYRAANINGPWTNLGDPFSAVNFSEFHIGGSDTQPPPSGYQYNNNLFEKDGKLYMLFDCMDASLGGGGFVRQWAMVELDAAGKAVVNSIVLSAFPASGEPNYLEETGTPRIYHLHNGVGANLGFLEAGVPLHDRLPQQYHKINFSAASFEIAQGQAAYLKGAATQDAAGVHVNGMGGLKGSSGGNIGDFTLEVDFELTANPGPGKWAFVFTAESYNWNFNVGNYINFYITDAGHLITHIGGLWSNPIDCGIASLSIHTLRMYRNGANVYAYLDGVYKGTVVYGTILSAMRMYSIGFLSNYGGYPNGYPPYDDFHGTVSRIIMINAYTPIIAGVQYDTFTFANGFFNFFPIG